MLEQRGIYSFGSFLPLCKLWPCKHPTAFIFNKLLRGDNLVLLRNFRQLLEQMEALQYLNIAKYCS